ncbi:MAG: hypothetical protein AMS27_06605 [Bacteroides sp. SM23_62_1]|nr:MAG: hypothetical protein AMS27_06605 [Bacteroides sp. SM23_62_1]
MVVFPTHLKKFITLLIILTITIFTAGMIIFHTTLKEYYFTGFPILPFFFFGITLFIHMHLLRISRGDIKKFTPRFIGTTGIKMIIYFALIALYLLIDRRNPVSFLICFLVMYLLYTIFEIVSVLQYLKTNK